MEQETSQQPRLLSEAERVEVLANLSRDQRQAIYQTIGALLNFAESRLTAEAKKPAPSAQVFAVIAGEKKAGCDFVRMLFPSDYQQNKGKRQKERSEA